MANPIEVSYRLNNIGNSDTCEIFRTIYDFLLTLKDQSIIRGICRLEVSGSNFENINYKNYWLGKVGQVIEYWKGREKKIPGRAQFSLLIAESLISNVETILGTEFKEYGFEQM
jgi:hypothetical protein